MSNPIPNTNPNLNKEIPKISKENVDTAKIRENNVEFLKVKAIENFNKITVLAQLFRMVLKHFFIIASIICLWIYVYHPLFWDQMLLQILRTQPSPGVHNISSIIQDEMSTIKATMNSAIKDIGSNTSWKAVAFESGKIIVTAAITCALIYFFQSKP